VEGWARATRASGSDTHLQPGWAWAYPAEEAERNADIHGPLVPTRAPGAGGAPRPLGWRIGAAWLVRDFGDFDDLGYDGAFLEVEAALTWERARWQRRRRLPLPRLPRPAGRAPCRTTT
jgi:hypothetical protein